LIKETAVSPSESKALPSATKEPDIQKAMNLIKNRPEDPIAAHNNAF
jgi:hypothetical protein